MIFKEQQSSIMNDILSGKAQGGKFTISSEYTLAFMRTLLVSFLQDRYLVITKANARADRLITVAL